MGKEFLIFEYGKSTREKISSGRQFAFPSAFWRISSLFDKLVFSLDKVKYFTSKRWVIQVQNSAKIFIPSCASENILLNSVPIIPSREKVYLGKVIGRVVCTQKDHQMHGIKLLLVTAVDSEGKPKGKPFVACDSIGAGFGETVFLCGGAEASLPFPKQRPPSDATILGIVDQVES